MFLFHLCNFLYISFSTIFKNSPNHIKNEPSPDSFKPVYLQFLLDNWFYSVQEYLVTWPFGQWVKSDVSCMVKSMLYTNNIYYECF